MARDYARSDDDRSGNPAAQSRRAALEAPLPPLDWRDVGFESLTLLAHAVIARLVMDAQAGDAREEADRVRRGCADLWLQFVANDLDDARERLASLLEDGERLAAQSLRMPGSWTTNEQGRRRRASKLDVLSRQQIFQLGMNLDWNLCAMGSVAGVAPDTVRSRIAQEVGESDETPWAEIRERGSQIAAAEGVRAWTEGRLLRLIAQEAGDLLAVGRRVDAAVSWVLARLRALEVVGQKETWADARERVLAQADRHVAAAGGAG